MSMTVTVFFEDPFYVGWVEHCEDSRLTVAKIVFGAEPSDAEVFSTWTACAFPRRWTA